MLGQLMNSPFVVGACYLILILFFVLAPLLGGRRENQFPDFSSAYADDPELELPSKYISEDDVQRDLAARLAKLSDEVSSGTGHTGSGFAL